MNPRYPQFLLDLLTLTRLYLSSCIKSTYTVKTFHDPLLYYVSSCIVIKLHKPSILRFSFLSLPL